MTAMLDTVPRYRYTYGDYKLWQGDDRWELIDGEAFLMSPAPSFRHQEIVLELGSQLSQFLRGKTCKVAIAPVDVRLPSADEADDAIDTVVQPDLVVVCDRGKIDRAGIRGAPDLVVEVLSPSTSVRDQVLKRDLYESHGVREYWIVDPEADSILVYRLTGTTFGPALRRESSFPCSVLPAFELDWQQLFPAST